MGPASAQLLYELGYDPDDGVPDVRDVEVGVGEIVRARDGAVQVAVARLGSGKLVVVVDECRSCDRRRRSKLGRDSSCGKARRPWRSRHSKSG